jgi:7-cyano-7-deazaguanine synthase
MTPDRPAPRIGLLFSGGLDSSILLGHLLCLGHRVQPFYVRCQLVWEPAELHAARSFLDALAARFPARLEPLVVLDLPLADVYQAHWSITGRQAPDASSADDAVYLPGRNAILLVKAAVWCRLHGIDGLALGVLASNPFADATSAFFEQFQQASNTALEANLEVLRPFSHLTKAQVMELGRGLPLQATFSCIAPRDGLHCGRCTKCAERRGAFRLLDVPDPTRYALPTPAAP